MADHNSVKNKSGSIAWGSVIAAALCVIVMLFLLFGFAKAVIAPKDINYYENRLAEQLPQFTAESYGSGSFQEDMDSALADQIPGAQRLKRSYNEFWASFMGGFCEKLSERFPNTYFNYDTISVFGSYLVYPPQTYEKRTEALKRQAESYNSIARGNPDTDFYAYAIETDADINFETGEKRPAWELVKNCFEFPEENMACFEIESFEQYRELFYRTDHHWNHRGSYAGYCEIADMMGYEPLEAGEAILVHESFAGNKALGYLQLDYSEAFYVYGFEHPAMSYMAENESVDDYGSVNAILNGESSGAGYGVYGGDCGQLVLCTDREELDDLLILGDSYDNALIKLLASHHDETHSVDLRYYNEGKGGFDLNGYIAEYGIEKVLLVGSTNVFFGSEDFIVEN